MSEPNSPALTPTEQSLLHALLSPSNSGMSQAANSKRRALAKAITLIESTRTDHRQRAQQLLSALLPYTGQNAENTSTLRIGISGVPGVGKSTFIEHLGNYLIDAGARVAVLAVDPSSSLSGGSILGDKTRMESLCQRSEAFIRPSPSCGSLGGVADKTREAMLLCEAAGFNVIIVETVGVGQSEIAVAGMVDLFVLLQLANAGDDLQAIKKGIVELADLIVFNKADLDPRATEIACAQMQSAVHLLRPNSPHWQPPVLSSSAAQGHGIAEFWAQVTRYRDTLTASGEFAEKRQRQALNWMWNLIDSGLARAFRAHPQVRAQLAQLSQAVLQGETPPGAAADQLLRAWDYSK
ncbi:MAG: methylmalonyl Co-A mutase-associated GTPase MeaB [Pseudomonadota bacterium]